MKLNLLKQRHLRQINHWMPSINHISQNIIQRILHKRMPSAVRFDFCWGFFLFCRISCRWQWGRLGFWPLFEHSNSFCECLECSTILPCPCLLTAPLIRIGVSDYGEVSCGDHNASSCSDCPNGPNGCIGETCCNGDCFWTNNECQQKGKVNEEGRLFTLLFQ